MVYLLVRKAYAASAPCPSGLNASMHARPHYVMCLHNPLELVSSALYSSGYWGEREMYPFIIFDSLKRSMAELTKYPLVCSPAHVQPHLPAQRCAHCRYPSPPFRSDGVLTAAAPPPSGLMVCSPAAAPHSALQV